MPDITTSLECLGKLPQMLGEVRTGISMLQTLASAPAAAAATGSPPASLAIVALSAELAYLLADLVKELDDDIDGITQVAQNYQSQEDLVQQLASVSVRQLVGASQADRPRVGAGATRAERS
jgi:predicted exporter